MLFPLLLLAAAPGADEPTAAWLTGEWCTQLEKGSQTCELWLPLGGGTMEGVSKTLKGGQMRVEAMRIVRNGARLTFHAEPPGQAPTDFEVVPGDRTPLSLTFENRRHDYPQRIRYWREGEALMAEISLADGTRPMRWRYLRK